MIHLRVLTADDEPVMLTILTDNHIKQTYMLPDFSNKQDASPLFHRLMELSQDERYYVRGILRDGLLIGFLNHVELSDKSMEIGYVIHPDYQGHGYMTNALTLAIQELFALGYEEVTAGAFEENRASIRVMEHVGMHKLVKTDTIVYRGKEHRCVYYSIKNQE